MSTSQDQKGSSASDKRVTVSHPGERKPKPTAGKKKHSLQTDHLDAEKRLQKCKDEGSKRLDLTKCSITTLPTSIKDLVHLTELYIYQNKLSTIPPEVGYLVNLEILAVNENILASLPDTLVNLKALRLLDLRHNKLNEIPSVVYQLTSLSILHLRYNRIKSVGEDISNLTVRKVFSLFRLFTNLNYCIFTYCLACSHTFLPTY